MSDIRSDEIFEKMEEERQSHFDKLHSKELMSIGKNFTQDEQVDVCKVVSSKVLKEEYERRIVAVNNILSELTMKMSEYDMDMDLIAKEEFIAEIRQIVRV